MVGEGDVGEEDACVSKVLGVETGKVEVVGRREMPETGFTELLDKFGRHFVAFRAY